MHSRYLTIAASSLFLIVYGDQAGAQSFNRTSSMSSGFGTSGFGTTGTTTSGISGGLGSTTTGSRQMGTTSATGGTGGFSNTNRFSVDTSANQGFVGRDSQDVQSFFSASGTGRQNFMQALGLQSRTDRPTTGQGNQQTPVRVTLRVAFDPPTVPPETAGLVLKTHLVRSFRGRLIDPSVTVQDRTAILEGQVSSNHEKLLAEKLALLEPGVSQVENRLVVTSISPN
ncbi:MAG: BON domain-containing protein [Pirellulales bacterium]|nr:BON domain-containing protein [Pirellulales bacterium]